MKQIKENSSYVGKFLEKDYNQFKDGLMELLEDYKRKSQRLDKIIKQSDKMQMDFLKLNEELNDYKNNLEHKVEEEIAKRKEKEEILLAQSKFAAMGEMIDAIAHQWIQPLSIIKMHTTALEFDFLSGKLDENYIQNHQEKVFNLIEHMTTTLNEFRTFLREHKEHKAFHVKEMIEKVLLLVNDEFSKKGITIVVNIEEDFECIGIENQFKHIILNILNNAKDALVGNHIGTKEIAIKAYVNEKNKIIEISDNAGGINEEIMDEIFKANISSKDDKGTGIGLYMSKVIAQKNNTNIYAVNTEIGAKFVLEQALNLEII